MNKGLVQGYVKLKKDNDVIYDDFNMITTKGREFILTNVYKNLLKGNFTKSENGTFDNDDYKISAIAFGSGTGDVLTGDNPQLNIINDYVIELNNKAILNREVDSTNNCIKLSIQIVASDSMNTSVSELGLYLTKDSSIDIKKDIIEKNGILFSRISFDPVPMVPSTNLSLDYYIYF